MRISEIKKMESHEVVFNLANVYAMLVANYNLHRGTEQLEKQFAALLNECEKRGILTQEETNYLMNL